jgi:nucleoid-associated protein YgaU
MHSVTREQKLALIIGFSLVLLVGVLISDHLSRARQARIASVGGSESPAPLATGATPRDPLKGLEIALNTPATISPATAPGPTEPVQSMPPQPQVTVAGPSEAPITIAQGTSHGSADDTPLLQAVKNVGGTMLVGKNGVTDIILPGAVKTTAMNAPTPNTAQQVSQSPSSANPPKTLATNETIRLHAVQKGETMFQIAAKYYGTGHLWQELAKFNGVANKDGVVRVGTRLRIPSKDVLLGRPTRTETAGRTSPLPPSDKAIPGRRQDLPVVKPEIKLATYTVKKGETLGEISKKVLGSSKRCQELAEFNKLEDEDSIPAGTVLKVPPMRG